MKNSCLGFAVFLVVSASSSCFAEGNLAFVAREANAAANRSSPVCEVSRAIAHPSELVTPCLGDEDPFCYDGDNFSSPAVNGSGSYYIRGTEPAWEISADHVVIGIARHKRDAVQMAQSAVINGTCAQVVVE